MHAVIIGGGASGLMAALSAAEAGHTVTLLERQSRVGRKLMATGNGRCNLSNLKLTSSNFHGTDPSFPAYALQNFSPEDTLRYFYGLGLITVAEPDGKVYPFSDQAGSVLDVLRFAAEAAGVEIRTACPVCSITRKEEGFLVETETGTLYTQNVIICCGGMAGGKLGGTDSGYKLLQSLGHSRTKLCPALVQLKTDPTYVRALKGVRAQAGIRLMQKGRLLAQETGEVQFTDYGLSGPAIFAISRAASTAADKPVVHLDLLQHITAEELEAMLYTRQAAFPELTLENLLTGMLHNRLGRTMIRYAGLNLNTPVSDLDASDISKICDSIKDFPLEVIGTPGFDGAQVTAGGMRTDEFDPQTMQSRLIPGLYAAGEVLDIDGDCGGFNLQWAWSSGYLAGKLRK